MKNKLFSLFVLVAAFAFVGIGSAFAQPNPPPSAVSMATTNATSVTGLGWQIGLAFGLLGAATMWALGRQQLAQLLK